MLTIRLTQQRYLSIISQSKDTFSHNELLKHIRWSILSQSEFDSFKFVRYDSSNHYLVPKPSMITLFH
jgi:hypothetical protein